MRRLPIYFLIDISESMIGEPIEQVQEGIATIIKELKTDPYALETVWVSIIGFAGKSKIITPLQDIITFYPPKIPVGSGTSLSKGLSELMASFDRDIVKSTFEKKGDWKPLVFLFTDGIPTDNPETEIQRWNNNYRNKCNMVAISIGENTNYNLLGKITDQVLLFNNTNSQSYKDFFKWVTASIKATSEQVTNENKDGINLSKANSGIVEEIDLSKKHIVPDNNFVVVNGKCATTDKSYLIKFKKDTEDSSVPGFSTRFYKVEGAYKIDENSYRELSENGQNNLKINSDELRGNPSCPSCANNYALATCQCGGIHCISGQGASKCPWCGNEGFYGISDESFDIGRTLG